MFSGDCVVEMVISTCFPVRRIHQQVGVLNLLGARIVFAGQQDFQLIVKVCFGIKESVIPEKEVLGDHHIPELLHACVSVCVQLRYNIYVRGGGERRVSEHVYM